MSYKKFDQADLEVIKNIIKDDERIYDTSKLDISKIVGLNNELDKTLDMIDQLQDDSSSKHTGGEH